jgi:hypothetical protein
MDVQFTPSMGVAGAFAGWSQVAREEKVGWSAFAYVRVPTAQNGPSVSIAPPNQPSKGLDPNEQNEAP